MRGTSTSYGKPALDNTLASAVRQYRRHLELVYPFLGFGIVSLLLEFRFELLFELFDIDRSVGITVDPDPLREWLSEPIADAIVPVLEEVFILLVLGVLSLFGFALLVFLFVSGLAFLVAADELSGAADRTQTARAVTVLRRLPALFAASLLGTILVAAGSLLFVLPGVYLAGRVALGGPAIVIDGHGPLAGIREGWRRSSGQLLEVVAVTVGGALVVALVGFVPLLGEALAVLVLLPVLLLTLGTLYADAPAA